MDLNIDKSEIRRRIRAMLAEEVTARGSATLMARVSAMPQFKEARTVLLYCSMPDEPDTDLLIRSCLGLAMTDEPNNDLLIKSCLGLSMSDNTDSMLSLSTKRVVLPLVAGETLLLKEVRSMEELRVGYKGIMEPSETCPDVDPSEIDFALVPGVAFTADGMRLGRGKGFYDRLLPLVRGYKVAAAFPCQILPSLPVDPWDAPLDSVIY